MLERRDTTRVRRPRAPSGGSTSAARRSRARTTASPFSPPAPPTGGSVHERSVTRAGRRPRDGAFRTTVTLDAARGTLLVPAGNHAPDLMPELRPGNSLFTNSVIGLDARAGAMVGSIQIVKDDFHDRDVSTGPVLITTRSGRSLVVSANRDVLLTAGAARRLTTPRAPLPTRSQ